MRPLSSLIVIVFAAVFVLAAAPATASDYLHTIDFVAPNPSRTTSRFQYTVARPGRVRLEVADVAGRIVSVPVDAVQPAGRYQSVWHGERLSAGLYFVRLTTPDRTVSMKFTRVP